MGNVSYPTRQWVLRGLSKRMCQKQIFPMVTSKLHMEKQLCFNLKWHQKANNSSKVIFPWQIIWRAHKDKRIPKKTAFFYTIRFTDKPKWYGHFTERHSAFLESTFWTSSVKSQRSFTCLAWAVADGQCNGMLSSVLQRQMLPNSSCHIIPLISWRGETQLCSHWPCNFQK